ncbi:MULTISPECIES: periplasmic heavy metal sensor [Rhodopseudomonas]|uniref:Periplasmic heavy metal sensor n=1 Tax=Rhodopseudomonas palustris TaxID=1076 RepID=A0A0D7ENV1_RHOPL|nr:MULTISPECIES: periplasmic heavy metal sensor [Rhodopseudomonas]KIZ42321.1 hypothetical protein OO17_13085 [Rhodopseudomonas palustris]MDF3813439.1 periplasmic heavy metal sensor [Rhodopseudomonas sp. BAL398]WOK17365.1 periplasmic heavy metal sensor [Rhodopseudomonas sp. BAL398]
MTIWPNAQNRVRLALLASLCLNVALAAYVSAQWFQSPIEPGWTPGGAGMPSRLIERVAARLPKGDADIVWRVYRAKQEEIRPLQADYVQALRETLRLIGQPELDKPALRAAIRNARDKRIKIGDAVIDSFVDTLEQISTPGRRQLVGRFLR